ncbi:MAG: regulatory protein GemA [Azoarcus sp.]|jgi:phage gp16-like protein|nr:regulatory protein GemA [Azoarcus sp.]
MSAKTVPPADRAKLTRAVFAACRANGLDESARHDVIKSVTGKSSLTDCNVVEIGLVLDRLNRGQPRNSKAHYEGRRRSRPSADRAAQRGKIDALLAELHRVTGEVHSLAYADAIARKNKWGDSVDFCDGRGLSRLIATLTRTLAFKSKPGRTT